MIPGARPGHSRGFMMIEMLAALILLTAFALVATRVFTWSMRVTAEAPAAEGQILLDHFKALDTDGNNGISLGEMEAQGRTDFASADRDGDGDLD